MEMALREVIEQGFNFLRIDRFLFFVNCCIALSIFSFVSGFPCIVAQIYSKTNRLVSWDLVHELGFLLKKSGRTPGKVKKRGTRQGAIMVPHASHPTSSDKADC